MLGLGAFPAASPAADPMVCTEGAGLRYAARVATVKIAHGTRTEVRVCDRRTGEERIVRRLRVRVGDFSQWGGTVRAAAATGRHVAWLETRLSRGRTTGTVVRADARGRVRERRRFRLPEPARGSTRFDVAVLRDGSLIWSLPDGLIIARRGRRAVTERLPGGVSVAVEDGVTLRIGDGSPTYRDLLTPRVRDGCPVRSAFSPLFATADHVVSAATYGEDDGGNRTLATRVCLRGRGLDPVATTAGRVVAVAGERVAVSSSSGDRYICSGGYLSVIELRTRRPLRSFESRDCGAIPFTHELTAMTASGAVAWLASAFEADDVATRVLALPASGPPVELDRGPSGSIAELASGPGETFTWRHDGEPRSAPPP